MRITPVVNFEEVVFNGAVCKNVSIANYKRFKELNLSKGDDVIITYNNDVLCYLHLDPSKKQLNKPIKFIEKCPLCHEPLHVNENETFVSCINSECSGRKIGKIENYLIKIGLKGIKESTIERLFQARLIKNIEDLYRVTITEMMSLEGFQSKMATNVYDIIHSKMELKSFELLGSLHIDQFSIRSAREIMKRFTVDELLELHKHKKEFIDTISQIEGFKEITATHIYNGLKENKKSITALRQILTVHETKVDTSKGKVTKGYKFVFTGFRDKDLQSGLEEQGHSVTSSVSKNTDYLVVKDVTSTSSKVTKAKEIGVKVISIEEAKSML